MKKIIFILPLLLLSFSPFTAADSKGEIKASAERWQELSGSKAG